MAHQLKYYKDIVSQGHEWRLEIHQKTDESLTAVEIGPVLQGLRLIVQGDQADIDTPIVKTSLEMVFVDANDLEDDRKCGYWEEFYTSSATEYLVQLLKDGVTEWSGYITPDSFSESLQYRGSVTIIARDNLGALQDYEYDALADSTGMISMYSLIEKALAVISFPMSYGRPNQGTRRFAYTNDTTPVTKVYEVMFNSKAFQDGTWLDALESALTATGLVLRYVGENKFAVASIRDIPLYNFDYWWDVPILETKFCAYGQRELSPAVKTIIDEVQFQIEENIAENDMPAKAYGEQGEYTILTQSDNIAEYPVIYPMPVHAVVGGSWSPRTVDTSMFLNPFAFPLKEGHSSKKQGDLRDTSVVYLAANNEAGTETDRTAEWKCLLGPGKYRFSMKLDNPVALYDDNTKIGHIDLSMYLSRLRFHLRFLALNGVDNQEYRTSDNQWYNGITSTSANSLFPNVDFPATFEFPVLNVNTIGEIQLLVTYVGTSKKTDSPSGVSKGAYVPFKEFSLTDVDLENTSIPGSQKVTTNYNNKNNILVQRRPEFGFNDADVASPKIIKNGMYILKDGWYESSDQWRFHNSDAPNPLPVLIHQQLLAYYSKPNNVLTGELATANPLFNALYEWNGKKHLLTSGTLNVLTGRIENASLRELTRYDRMWETWVENEDMEIGPRANTSAVFYTHSKKEITKDDVYDLPSWARIRFVVKQEGYYEVVLRVEENETAQKRQAIARIDTAFVRITQLAREYEMLEAADGLLLDSNNEQIYVIQ